MTSTKDVRYKAYLTAYVSAALGESVGGEDDGAVGDPTVFVAILAIAVRHAKDGDWPASFADFTSAMQKLGVID